MICYYFTPLLNNKTIAVVVPAYNEEKQIGGVIETMPAFVDRIVVVNDCSTDQTAEIVQQYIEKDTSSLIEIKSILDTLSASSHNRADVILRNRLKEENQYFPPSEIINQHPERERLILITQNKNYGVGAAIARGYKWCNDHAIDCTAVMAGDGQMYPTELESICRPVIDDDIDYVKGNRLIHRSACLVIPKVRYFGNAVLSILTKIASGYWHVSDTQSGYTAISNKALNAIPLHKIYKKYGMPNDMLVRLNIAFCTIKEVGIMPVYDIGEKSKMNVLRVIPNISWLLFKSFVKRLWVKYLFRNFHPLFLLYHLAFILLLFAVPYAIDILDKVFIHETKVDSQDLMIFIFLSIFGFQSLLFAIWMDIQDNERLHK